jgi:hypothetical protein
MAKHANDPGTIDAFPAKRGRGRPATGQAMSDAERARRYRARQREAGISVTQKTITQKLDAAWPEERARLIKAVDQAQREIATLIGERKAAYDVAEAAQAELRKLGTARVRQSDDASRLRLAAQDAYLQAKALVPRTGPIKRSTVQQILTLMRRVDLA